MALYKHEKNQEVEKERDLLFSIVDGQGGASDIIFVKSKSRQVKLNTSEIYFVEALKDYVVINLLGSRYTIHSTMKDIERKLNGGDFIRVHRSFIVRLDKIAAIEQSNLFLENEKKSVPIGGSYKIDLQKKLKFV
jgi:DNA-binding LytR/AlgR family response regulator